MYKILNQSVDSTEILLYSLIEGGTTAAKVIKALQASPSENITLRINSDGGEVFDAIAIYNYLKDKHITVIIDGMCASAASIVAMSGEKIIMQEGSMMMIHNPVTLAFGESEDLKTAAGMLDKVTELITDIYEAKTGLDRAEIEEMMAAQTWMTPVEALTYGFCDEVDSAGEYPPLEAGDRIYEDITDKVRAQQGLPELATAYDNGIKAERERLKALDELYTPGRASIINRAKYETGESAQEIALELLKSERVRESIDVNNLKAADSQSQVIDSMAEYIRQRRSK